MAEIAVFGIENRLCCGPAGEAFFASSAHH